MATNTLYYGDNLHVLRDKIQDESVDLIYIDPPFNSAANYNVIFREHTGDIPPEAQIRAFKDTWTWTHEAAAAIDDLMTINGEVAEFLDFTVRRLGENSLSAYLAMMAVRLVELHRVLKPTGSFYLHCDPTASHYLKVLCDVVFGVRNFQAEITWKRSSAHSDTKQGRKALGNIADIIFYYTKGDTYTFNTQYTDYDEGYIKSSYKYFDESGRRYRLDNLTGPGGAGKGNPQYEVMGVIPIPIDS